MILVTGSNGQLGSELRVLEAVFSEFKFYFTDINELDLTDSVAVTEYLREHSIRFVLNCAAYTAVDRAESDAERCYQINRDAVAHLSDAVAEVGGVLIHVSTDYVFDGCQFRPYVETDVVAPNSIYGHSKLEGEHCVLRYPQHIVVRTSWLYSSFGSNFVKTMLRLGNERDVLNVVFDQIGTPTYAADLAQAMLFMVTYLVNHPDRLVGGIYHFSNEGVCSWYDFTMAIHRLARITSCKIKPVEGAEFPTVAVRPHYSVLNKRKIKETFGLPIAHWEESLRQCITLIEKTK